MAITLHCSGITIGMGPSSSKCHRQMLVVDFVILINQSSLKSIKPATLQVTATRVNTFELYWQVSLLCRNKWILSLHAYLAKWGLGSFAESNIVLSYLFKIVLIFCQIFLNSLVHPKCFKSFVDTFKFYLLEIGMSRFSHSFKL